MGGGRLLLVVAILLAAAPVAHAQKTCRIQNGAQTVEYPCSGFDGPQDEPAAESFWSSNAFQAGLAILGLVGSAGAAAFGYWRLRRRRDTLRGYLGALEREAAHGSMDPAASGARLVQLRAQLRERHDRGQLDDGQFLDLDMRYTKQIAKLRVLEIDRRFARLPPLLVAELRRMVSDGVLMPSEADLIEVRAAAYRVADPERGELIALARHWAAEDSARAGAPVAAVA